MNETIALKEVIGLIDAEVLQERSAADEIRGAYCSDLLSDVMANAQEGNALITIQAHKNAVAVAGLFGAPCIIICNSRPVPDDMIDAAREEDIAIYRCTMTQFQASGILYRRMAVS
jgi:hypothetical protein